MRIDNDFAYVLHCSPFRDNSVIAHLLTQQQGKVSYIISGIKSPKSSKRALLQPCRKLSVSYTLKTNFSQLHRLELAPDNVAPPAIDSFMLYQYAHEVLLSILPSQLPAETIFKTYQQFLQQLAAKQPHKALRYLEITLIEQFLGLPELAVTQDTLLPVTANQAYYVYPEKGVFSNAQNEKGLEISGEHLQAFTYLIQHQQSLDAISEPLAQGAQPLSTYLIKQLLNGKQLKTRQIFKELSRYL